LPSVQARLASPAPRGHLAAEGAGQRRQDDQHQHHRQVFDDQPADGDAAAMSPSSRARPKPTARVLIRLTACGIGQARRHGKVPADRTCATLSIVAACYIAGMHPRLGFHFYFATSHRPAAGEACA